jgi:hypothetical protein
MAVAMVSLAASAVLTLIGAQSYFEGRGFSEPFDGLLGAWLWLALGSLSFSYLVYDFTWRKVERL